MLEPAQQKARSSTAVTSAFGALHASLSAPKAPTLYSSGHTMGPAAHPITKTAAAAALRFIAYPTKWQCIGPLTPGTQSMKYNFHKYSIN